MRRLTQALLFVLCVSAPAGARAGFPATFEPGSLIIPMDLAYQDSGIFQAYGLVFQLLRQGIVVNWVIDPNKIHHRANCNTAGDLCPWDCHEEGSGVKCPYSTASPDFYAAARVFWNNAGQRYPNITIANHGYRGGPFVIDAANAAAAAAIIDIWNDSTKWPANLWAQRTIFQRVAVHEVTAAFSAFVSKEMLAAPTIAVFSDGNENIATGYLRTAGIKQSNGNEFPAAKCGACGEGTPNPDMLTVSSVMGPMGTCTTPNYNHKNGALFTSDGVPAYCQIMSMHWNVGDRETVECAGGACGASQAACGGKAITYHGHEVVAEVRSFLNYPTHFFAECQAVNAYENTVPNPAWPFLDDAGRLGHFLTTTGNPPSCIGNGCPANADTAVACVVGGCDNGTRNCCLPTNAKEKGAGFLIGNTPASASIEILHPVVPYNQQDGNFATTGGSEPSYNLSTYLKTAYRNGRDVTFITGPDGPGKDDVWMTGYLDGACAIQDEGGDLCGGVGKVSYLGGHAYGTAVPMSTKPDGQGTRMFLNALFEADCVTSVGQPNMILNFNGDFVITSQSVPAIGNYVAGYENFGIGTGLAAVMTLDVPAGVAVTTFAPVGTVDGNGDLNWAIGSVGTQYGMAGDPAYTSTRAATLSFAAGGEYRVELRMSYRVGVSTRQASPQIAIVRVIIDSDGDGVNDADEDAGCVGLPCCRDLNGDNCDDCQPIVDVDGDGVCDTGDSNPGSRFECRLSDADNCDDCTSGTFDPANDGPDLDGDGLCDDGDPDIDGDGIANGADAARLNRFSCADSDGDTCDDCSVAGVSAPANDGPDRDGDGLCNAGDPDDDNDGIPDAADLCSAGETGWSSNAATDFDGDGCRDAGEDIDDDNDGIADAVDPSPLNRFACGDTDGDTCDDCSVAGMLAPADDGPDDDADGRCNAFDPAINDPLICGNLDADTCDDCSLGLGPDVLADGLDTDGDGVCDVSDTDDDGDGVIDGSDGAPLDRYRCVDSEPDDCDDCAIQGAAAPLDDGVDTDADGLCDIGDPDDDNDGITDGSDACPAGNTAWISSPSTDIDSDGCQDAGEDTDDDGDGLADTADDCAAGETGWTSSAGTDLDGDGCRDAGEDTDDDGDGVADTADDCAAGETGWTSSAGTDLDGDGCRDAGEDTDDDNDGIADTADDCAVGETGWTSSAGTDLDGDGCRDAGEDTDDDNDGTGDVEEAACGADPRDPNADCANSTPPAGQVYTSSCGCGASAATTSWGWALVLVAGVFLRRLRERRPTR